MNNMMDSINEYIKRTTDNVNECAKDGKVNKTILLSVIHTDILALNSTMAFIADKLADLVELHIKENKDGE